MIRNRVRTPSSRINARLMVIRGGVPQVICAHETEQSSDRAPPGRTHESRSGASARCESIFRRQHGIHVLARTPA